MKFEVSRRQFLATTGGAVGLMAWLDRSTAQEVGVGPPQRWVNILKPVGTVPDHFWPTGEGAKLSELELSRILRPLSPHLGEMCLFKGLGLPYDGSTGGGAERGMVLAATGRPCPELYEGNGGDDPRATGPSVEQWLLASGSHLADAPIASLQLGCDSRADTPGEVSTRHLSYDLDARPLTPIYQPAETYELVFASLMPGVDSDAKQAELRAARAKKRSVLDFALKDLKRMRKLAPVSQRHKLDSYEDAVRSLEKELDQATMMVGLTPESCGLAEAPERVEFPTEIYPYTGNGMSNTRDDLMHRAVGEAHLAIVRAAFLCDLTRVVSLLWSPGTNHLSFGGMWPSDPNAYRLHHKSASTLNDDNVEFLTRVDEWYMQRVSDFIQSLKDTADAEGKALFDSTLVSHISEEGDCFFDSWDDVPWMLFGGRESGLLGDQLFRHEGAASSAATSPNMRSTNDFWMSVVRAFGADESTLFSDVDTYSGAIDGVFS